MKKIYTTILSVAVATTMVNAQTCVLSENFTTYSGSATALPSGWIGMNLNAAATGNIYNTAASSGPSGANSFKFGTPAVAGTKPTLISPTFTVANGDSISFWLKGNSLDSASKIEIYVGTDTSFMYKIKTYTKANIAVVGQLFTEVMYSSEHVMKFVYTKSAGNIGMDDFCVKTYAAVGVNDTKRFEKLAIRYSSNKLSVNANSTVVLHNIIGQQMLTKNVTANETIDLSSLTQGIYIVNAINGTTRTTKKIIVE